MFDEKIWDGFDEKTAEGKAPYLFESMLPLDKNFAGSDVVEYAFHTLSSQHSRETIDCRIRVYDGEHRRDDLIELACTLPRLEGETLVAFMRRLTGKERFSLVINNLEQASPRLAMDFGLFLESFFKFKGIPLGGVEQAAFCGNYAGTAFGIHEGYEHAFLCHLGPGVKDFYCWTREEYLSHAQGREPTFANDNAYKKLLKTGKLFVLKPGDVLYLPASVYHIGRQDQYSVSVALPFYTYPFTRFLAGRVIPDLCHQTLPFDQEGMSPLLPLGKSNPLQISVCELLVENLSRWSDNALPEYLSYYWHRLVSNGGWELPRAIAAKVREEGPLVEPLSIKPGDRVRLCAPSRVTQQAGLGCTAGQRRLFAGARSVVLDDPDGSSAKWLERLNEYQALEVHTEQQRIASQALSRTGCLELI
ncbi:JmjC domain-containing protein [Pseudomonas koreensis]